MGLEDLKKTNVQATHGHLLEDVLKLVQDVFKTILKDPDHDGGREEGAPRAPPRVPGRPAGAELRLMISCLSHG